MKFINIDDLIDDAFAKVDNWNNFFGRAHLDEATSSKLQSLEAAERTNQILVKRAEAERLERERLMQLKRDQIERDLKAKAKREALEAIEQHNLLLLDGLCTLSNDIVKGVIDAVTEDIGEVVQVNYLIITDIKAMLTSIIAGKSYKLNTTTMWWLRQVVKGSEAVADPTLATTIDVLSEIIEVFNESGFKLSLI